MRRGWLCLAVAVGALLTGLCPARAFNDQETLHYSVNWPSGLSLGEASFSSRLVPSQHTSEAEWRFEFRIDGALPGFAIADNISARASDEFCSLELHKEIRHGRRTAKEKTTLSPKEGAGKRETLGGGGTTELRVAPCTKDGLTFLYFLRRELRLGRVPPTQPVLFGAAYQVSVQFGGTQTLVIGGKRVEADRLDVSFKGPASERKFEMFCSRDQARTPLLIRAPFELGWFSMELVR
jgi:hypothetical protein